MCIRDRLEDFAANFLGDAATGVGDGQEHIFAGGLEFARGGLEFIVAAGGQAQRDAALGGDGVAGVEAEVDEDLFELAGVNEEGRCV